MERMVELGEELNALCSYLDYSFKLISKHVHYVEMPWRQYASANTLREEFASNVLQILNEGEKDLNK